MNTILQQRIEEAADEYQNLVIEETKCHHNHTMTYAQGYEDARLLVKPTFIDAADWALQNQWISVDEALPEDKTKVFVIVKTPVGIVHRADYHINDYWYMSRYSPEEIVTHWMPIPSLGGGER